MSKEKLIEKFKELYTTLKLKGIELDFVEGSIVLVDVKKRNKSLIEASKKGTETAFKDIEKKYIISYIND
jgi:hypothetical protein